jgi:hypothetical protein
MITIPNNVLTNLCDKLSVPPSLSNFWAAAERIRRNGFYLWQ